LIITENALLFWVKVKNITLCILQRVFLRQNKKYVILFPNLIFIS
jgi:hypothetical protein